LLPALAGEHGRQAAAELWRAGAAAVPLLAAALGKPDAWKDGDAQAARGLGVEILWHLGPDAAAGIDALLDHLDDPASAPQRQRVLEAIGRIAPYHHDRCDEVEKHLGDHCDKGGYFGTTGFFETLSRLKFDAGATLPELLRGLEHDNPFVRELAAEAVARALARTPPGDKQRAEVLAALTAALAAEVPTQFKLDWKWNGNTASTSGGAANGERLRLAIGAAIAVLTPDDPAAIPGIGARLQHLDPRVRAEAARQLGTFGADAAAQVPALTGLLTDDLLVAREAATTLGMIGKDAAAALPALEQAAASTDRQLQQRARAALRQIKPE